MTWIEVVTWVFVITNTGRLLAYIPQFISAWACTNGAKSVSILTWSYFTFSNLTALLYAFFVLRDSKSVWVFSGNLTVTFCLCTLLICKRLMYLKGLRREHTNCSDVSFANR
jgi:uncharacterized protein with PQ loop repeat